MQILISSFSKNILFLSRSLDVIISAMKKQGETPTLDEANSATRWGLLHPVYMGFCQTCNKLHCKLKVNLHTLFMIVFYLFFRNNTINNNISCAHGFEHFNNYHERLNSSIFFYRHICIQSEKRAAEVFVFALAR